ncbi:asparagine synthase C-terminal domain-containing protein, partial [Bacillus licheniformis]|uniref:asparagine synthase C-terminal domain-containing protein n=1 Tax=Bacillus licheniformis TaxID=1402 RepID=UPI0021B3DD47
MERWVRGDILVKGEKMRMGNSVEVGVPFLEKVVFEGAWKIGEEVKRKNGRRKYVVRKGGEGMVREDVVNGKKVGFRV